MENIATKKFRYDHTSSYKSRGRSGVSNRLVRAQRANEKRHVSRMDEISKRRRIPLSSLVDDNVVDVKDKETNGGAKEINRQPHLSRKEQLLKWREERKSKNLNAGNEKKSFLVRHVRYDQDTSLFAVKTTVRPVKGDAKCSKPNNANNVTKKVTRVSARLEKQSNNTTSKPLGRAVKHSVNKAKDIDKQNERPEGNHGKTVRVTRQSVRSKMPSCQEPLASESEKGAPKSKNQVKTRSQMKMLQHPATCPASSSGTEEHANAVDASKEKTSKSQQLKSEMPDTIKNTVSFGRGNAEGIERCQMSLGKEMRLQSFAPADFQFTAPDGVNTFTYFSKTFKFEPLSPNSAEKFMFPTPSSLLSPQQTSAISANVGAEGCQLAKYNPPLCSNVDSQEDVDEPFGNRSSAGDTEVCTSSSEELRGDLAPCAGESTSTDHLSHASSANKQDTVTERAPNCVIEMSCTSEAQGEHHDPLYFRDLVKKETERLNKFCDKWERINGEEQDLREEDRGQIRTTIGQAQLLIDQRFRQFSGLIDLSEDKQAEKRATTSDLQGFWDMIYFQIEDVDAKFDALEKLKENNWQEEVKKVKKAARRGTAKKPASIKGSNASSKTAASKSRIQAMRNALKAKMAADRVKLKSDLLNAPQEEEAFITILTPMKRSKKEDGTDEVVLTPVRRSNRKTPQKLLVRKNTPVVVTTPKKISGSSPGLRLTPQVTDCVHDEEALPLIGSESDKPHDNGCGKAESWTVMQEGDDEETMECDDDKQRNPAFEPSCTPASQSRKTPGKVTFQSPGNLDGDYQHTLDVSSAASEAECGNSAVTVSLSDDAGVGGRRSKRSTPRCISARRCRGRTATPYNDQRLTRRISEDEKDGDSSTKTDSETASDSESGSTCTVSRVQGSQLRRSTRRTPSKYRDPMPTHSSENEHGKTPLDVSVKLFCAEESEKTEANNVAQETTSFSRYLCPSLSDEDDNTALASTELEEGNAFAEIESDAKKSPSSENLNLTAEVPEETRVERAVTTSQSRPSRTPLHILQYLSDMETPSPNSRQVTPMPKTTLFISPPGSTETAVIGSNLTLTSPENVISRFPAQKDIVPLVSLTPGGHALATTPGKLPIFHLDDSPVNGENRRDSVFFAPTHSSEVRGQDNLMLFSPVPEVNEEGQD